MAGINATLEAAFTEPAPDPRQDPAAHARWMTAQVLKTQGLTQLSIQRGKQLYRASQVTDQLLEAIRSMRPFPTGAVTLSFYMIDHLLGGAPGGETLRKNASLTAGINAALEAAFTGPAPDLTQDPEAHARWTIAQALKARGLTYLAIEKGLGPQDRAFSAPEVAGRLLQAVSSLPSVPAEKMSLSLKKAGAFLNESPGNTTLSRNPLLVTGINAALEAAFAESAPDPTQDPEAYARWTMAQALKAKGLTSLYLEKGVSYRDQGYDPAEVAGRLLEAVSSTRRPPRGNVIFSFTQAARLLNDAPTSGVFYDNTTLVTGINAALEAAFARPRPRLTRDPEAYARWTMARALKARDLTSLAIQRGRVEREGEGVEGVGYDPREVVGQLLRSMLATSFRLTGVVTLGLVEASRLLGGSPTSTTLNRHLADLNMILTVAFIGPEPSRHEAPTAHLLWNLAHAFKGRRINGLQLQKDLSPQERKHDPVEVAGRLLAAFSASRPTDTGMVKISLNRASILLKRSPADVTLSRLRMKINRTLRTAFRGSEPRAEHHPTAHERWRLAQTLKARGITGLQIEKGRISRHEPYDPNEVAGRLLQRLNESRRLPRGTVTLPLKQTAQLLSESPSRVGLGHNPRLVDGINTVLRAAFAKSSPHPERDPVAYARWGIGQTLKQRGVRRVQIVKFPRGRTAAVHVPEMEAIEELLESGEPGEWLYLHDIPLNKIGEVQEVQDPFGEKGDVTQVIQEGGRPVALEVRVGRQRHRVPVDSDLVRGFLRYPEEPVATEEIGEALPESPPARRALFQEMFDQTISPGQQGREGARALYLEFGGGVDLRVGDNGILTIGSEESLPLLAYAGQVVRVIPLLSTKEKAGKLRLQIFDVKGGRDPRLIWVGAYRRRLETFVGTWSLPVTSPRSGKKKVDLMEALVTAL